MEESEAVREVIVGMVRKLGEADLRIRRDIEEQLSV